MNKLQHIQAALASLLHLPMWDAGWAGDIAWFQFGAQVQRPDGRGGQRFVGQYALRVSYPWRWCASSGFVRADESSDAVALKALCQPIPHFVAAARDSGGALILGFDNSDMLVIDDAGQASTDEEDIEYWRLLQPGVLKPHLVMSSTGVEWHEA